MTKPTIGQTVYSLNIGNDARRVEQKLTPYTVTSVGRKYFKAQREGSRLEIEVEIASGHEKSQFCHNHRFYETEQEWLDEKEKDELHKAIADRFSAYRGRNVPLEALRRIKAILEETV